MRTIADPFIMGQRWVSLPTDLIWIEEYKAVMLAVVLIHTEFHSL